MQLRVDPIQGFEPAVVRVGVIIPHDAENVAACLVIDGGDYYTNSCWELWDNSPAQFLKTFPGVPAGEYRVYLTVQARGGNRMIEAAFKVEER